MSKTFNINTPKKGNITRSYKSSRERDKSLDEASFTLVSYQRKAPVRAAKTPDTIQTNMASFQEVTKGNFHVFQKVIFPIVGKILEKNKTFNTSFSRQWIIGKQGTLELSENSTFRTVSKLLKDHTVTRI
jgi:hypothetical protein